VKVKRHRCTTDDQFDSARQHERGENRVRDGAVLDVGFSSVVTKNDSETLLLLMVAVALAHHRGVTQPEKQDYMKAARMLAAAWPQYAPVVDVSTMVA